MSMYLTIVQLNTLKISRLRGNQIYICLSAKKTKLMETKFVPYIRPKKKNCVPYMTNLLVTANQNARTKNLHYII